MFKQFYQYFDDNQHEFYRLVRKLRYNTSAKEVFFGFELSFADLDQEYDIDCECQLIQIILKVKKDGNEILIRAFAFDSSYEGFEVDMSREPEQVEPYQVTITKYREI